MRKISNSSTTSAACLGALILFCGCSVNGTDSGLPPRESGERAVEWVTDPESDSTEMLAVTLRGDGDFEIGADFPPGIYLSGGSRPGSVCAWQRIALDQRGSRTITGAGSGFQAQLVEVHETDAIFSSHSCLPWQMVK